MHEFTPVVINRILNHLNDRQPNPNQASCVLGVVQQVCNFVLLPNPETIDESIYLTLPGTNLTVIARPSGEHWHWSGLTRDGIIYNNDLIELVNIFLKEDGTELEFLIEQVSVDGNVVWVDGEFDFRLDGNAA